MDDSVPLGDGASLPEVPVQKPLPIWVLPMITGVAGLLLGASVVAGVWTVTGIAVADHKASVVEAAKAAAVKAENAKSKILRNAVNSCTLSGNPDADLEDGGYSLTVNGQGNNDATGLSIQDEACLLAKLSAPSAVISHIDQTTSMDGRQTETWNGVTFSWSYHPDRGLDGVFSVQK